jgi:DNA topoisomerase-1
MRLSKYLVIVESPTKARTLKRFLGNDYEVEASIGHINNLESGYGASKDGPVAGINENLEPIWELERGAKTRIANLKKIAKSADTIFLAADPDREGEGIAYHVANEINAPKEKYKRVVFHEITEKAVKEAFNNAGDINMDLVNAHIGRRLIDRIVGFTLSGLTSSLLRLKRLSVGRVQSVAVSIVKDREDEIKAFNPEEYWNMFGYFSEKNSEAFKTKLIKLPGVPEKDFHIPNLKEAEKIELDLKNAKFTIDSVKKVERSGKPRAPFTTSSLQQDASSRIRFNPSRTMAVAQQLFQGLDFGSGEEGLITYMRTDSTILSQDSLNEIENHVKSSFGSNYHEFRKYTTKASNAQEAHEAIRPTSIQRTPDSIKQFLDDDQFKLYDLIWKRTVASQMSNSRTEKTTITVSSGKLDDSYRFKTEADKLIFDGFKKLFPDKKDIDIPNIGEGVEVNLDNSEKEQKFTLGPPRYSEASLIKAMEDLGVGRPSTYASVIKVIKDKRYVWAINRSMYLTPIGNAIIEELIKEFGSSFMDYKFTEKMEESLDQIANGEEKREKFVKKFWDPEFKNLVEKFGSRAESDPRDSSEYNRIRTNIICSKKNPCVNSLTGKEFEESDPPIQTGSQDEVLEAAPKMIWIRFRNKKGDGAFLACEDRECKVTADERVWVSSGQRRGRDLESLKQTMIEKSLH